MDQKTRHTAGPCLPCLLRVTEQDWITNNENLVCVSYNVDQLVTYIIIDAAAHTPHATRLVHVRAFPWTETNDVFDIVSM